MRVELCEGGWDGSGGQCERMKWVRGTTVREGVGIKEAALREGVMGQGGSMREDVMGEGGAL